MLVCGVGVEQREALREERTRSRAGTTHPDGERWRSTARRCNAGAHPICVSPLEDALCGSRLRDAVESRPERMACASTNEARAARFP
jgi:hypothetical protein